jgi:hypothetical protein
LPAASQPWSARLRGLASRVRDRLPVGLPALRTGAVALGAVLLLGLAVFVLVRASGRPRRPPAAVMPAAHERVVPPPAPYFD